MLTSFRSRALALGSIALGSISVGVLTGSSLLAPAHSAESPWDLHLEFSESTPAPPLENSGHAALEVELVEAAGGSAQPVQRPTGGSALRLPEHTESAAAPMAAILVRPNAGPDDALDPRTRAFTFGADFRIDPRSYGSAADNGDNLIQRGLYGDSAQYKIQVDKGYLSCRVKGTRGAVMVTGDVPVSPRQWYTVRCHRASDTVRLELSTLEGQARSWSWSASGTIGPVALARGSAPLSVGGKVGARGEPLVHDSDQFNGQVDNVVFGLWG